MTVLTESIVIGLRLEVSKSVKTFVLIRFDWLTRVIVCSNWISAPQGDPTHAYIVTHRRGRVRAVCFGRATATAFTTIIIVCFPSILTLIQPRNSCHQSNNSVATIFPMCSAIDLVCALVD